MVDLSDQRGKSDGNKKPDDISNKVTNHILSFNPSISHYRRAHAQRECISPQSLTSLGCIKISVPQTLLRSPITTTIKKLKR